MLLIVKYYKKIVLSPKKTSLYNFFLVHSLFIYFKAKTTMCNAAFLRLPLSDCQNGRRAIVYFLYTMFLFCASIFSLSIFFLTGYAWKNLWTYQFYICRYIYPSLIVHSNLIFSNKISFGQTAPCQPNSNKRASFLL